MSDEKDTNQSAFPWAAVVGAGVGLAGLYYALKYERPKRIFIEEPDEVPEEDKVPLDEEMSAKERLFAQNSLAVWLESFRQAGTTDFDEHRELLAEKHGIRSPSDMRIPNDPIYRMLYHQWAHGWRWAEALHQLGFPPDKFDTKTTSEKYFAGVANLAKRAESGDALEANNAAVIGALIDAKNGTTTDAETVAALRKIYGI